jgi:rare lipoprotein A (peptidoglycan hydrolase)
MPQPVFVKNPSTRQFSQFAPPLMSFAGARSIGQALAAASFFMPIQPAGVSAAQTYGRGGWTPSALAETVETPRNGTVGRTRYIRTQSQYVIASFYGAGEPVGHYTASGEPFNPFGLTAAHRSLPFGTRISVMLGGRHVVVRINDRGPSVATGRSLDLSYGAARELGLTGAGVAHVRYSALGNQYVTTTAPQFPTRD